MFIISLHKKQKWLSYGAYAPLRQPRLSPLCGCECELIENVCFSTFLIAGKKEWKRISLFKLNALVYFFFEEVLKKENKILFSEPFEYNKTGIYTANIRSRFLEQNNKVVKMVPNGREFTRFNYKRFHFFKNQTRIEKIFFKIWDKYKNKNELEIQKELRKDIDYFVKNNIKIIDSDLILNKYL